MLNHFFYSVYVCLYIVHYSPFSHLCFIHHSYHYRSQQMKHFEQGNDTSSPLDKNIVPPSPIISGNFTDNTSLQMGTSSHFKPNLLLNFDTLIGSLTTVLDPYSSTPRTNPMLESWNYRSLRTFTSKVRRSGKYVYLSYEGQSSSGEI